MSVKQKRKTEFLRKIYGTMATGMTHWVSYKHGKNRISSAPFYIFPDYPKFSLKGSIYVRSA